MKKIIMVMLIAATIATSVNAQQPPPPDNAGMQPPPPGRERGMRPPPPNQQLQQVATYQGKVVKMNANDDYVYDGFYMLDNGDSLLIKFPPHLGTQITNAVKTGSTVSINGVLNISPMGIKEVRMISLTSGSNTITDTATVLRMPPVETYTSGNGKITQLQTNPEGKVSGLIIDNKTILRLPPHVATQLGNMAQNGEAIAYTGMKKTSKQGEVSTADYTIVHCKTITVKGQQYLVQ